MVHLGLFAKMHIHVLPRIRITIEAVRVSFFLRFTTHYMSKLHIFVMLTTPSWADGVGISATGALKIAKTDHPN